MFWILHLLYGIWFGVARGFWVGGRYGVDTVPGPHTICAQFCCDTVPDTVPGPHTIPTQFCCDTVLVDTVPGPHTICAQFCCDTVHGTVPGPHAIPAQFIQESNSSTVKATKIQFFKLTTWFACTFRYLKFNFILLTKIKLLLYTQHIHEIIGDEVNGKT